MAVIRPFHHFEGTRSAARPLERVEQVKTAALAFREEMLGQPKVLYYKTIELIRIPYPAKYAYLNAFSLPTPFVHLCNKVFIIQFASDEGIKTLLVSPSDWEHQYDTPYFANLVNGGSKKVAERLEKLIVRKKTTVLDALAQIGLAPEDVDYITYDHLHTQNLTRWLGGTGQAALFPNAKLLVMRQEWESTLSLLPWQNQWYCPQGIDGITDDRVILLDNDVYLGDGSVALMRTPGHTEGNHSIVAHTDQGLLVTSENGVSMDAYAPQHSKIAGLAKYARDTGAEVILNGNTLEQGNDQYLSMIQEKTVAGPYPHDPRFYNMALSSESDGFALFPGTTPTIRMGQLEFGKLQLGSRKQEV